MISCPLLINQCSCLQTNNMNMNVYEVRTIVGNYRNAMRKWFNKVDRPVKNWKMMADTEENVENETSSCGSTRNVKDSQASSTSSEKGDASSVGEEGSIGQDNQRFDVSKVFLVLGYVSIVLLLVDVGLFLSITNTFDEFYYKVGLPYYVVSVLLVRGGFSLRICCNQVMPWCSLFQSELLYGCDEQTWTA